MLHLHRGERADILAGALAELLSTGAQDPFAPELISVPSRGVERWLTQQLSLVLGAAPGRSDGVCANVEFPGPGRLVAEAVAAVSGIEARTDPWRPGRSVWPLLEVIEAEPGLLYGGPPPPRGPGRSRHYAAARHIAGLFDKYEAYRPQMITAWARGDESDGAGEWLDPDLQWQPAVWSRLRELVAVPSPAERLAAACEQLRADAAASSLPGRLSLFGLTRLPPSQLAVLAALAEHRDVHLWLLHPCPSLWERLEATQPQQPVRRRDDPSVQLPRHRLLSALGRDVRELQLTVGSVMGTATADTHHPMRAAEGQAHTVLERLQEAIRSDAPTDAEQPQQIDPHDRSVQVHSCHGRARQVDVVRDVILGLLAADPTLEPRDVVVMCPDIEAYAPLISATFGVSGEEQDAVSPAREVSPASLLRVRLADRSLRQTNPMMSAAATLLELVDARLTASEVLDFAASPPVRRRFGFDDDDLGRLAEWVAEAEVRWGLDAAHRAAYRLEAFGQNTWEAGLDRLLLGVTMAEGSAGGDASAGPSAGGWLGLALPLDDVDSSDIELVGRLAELVWRLRSAVSALSGPQSLAGWIESLGLAMEGLTLTSGAELWQSTQLRTELASVVEAAGERAPAVTLTLADVRSLLADRLRGRPTRANFRTGSLTMCTLVPMRSVPHRVVCLLGLDDGAFPRQPAVDGDDILLRGPITGERDERSEDRQLLLDAILAAGEHLVITYSGADERTNARRPPAVPVGELLDTLDAGFVTAAGRPAQEQLLTQHPLQPFDPRNFAVSEEPGGSGPFSFDPAALGGARSIVAPRREPPAFLARPLPPSPAADLELETLRMFFDHPTKGFLRQRLGLTLPRSEDVVNDRLPIELDNLKRWQIGQRMLDARLAGLDPATCRQSEWRRGALPPGKLGARVLDAVAAEVEQIVGAAQSRRNGPSRTLDLAVELPGGRRLTGTVGDVYASVLVATNFGKVNAKRRFRTWLSLLLLAAAAPGESFEAVTVGRQSQTEAGPLEQAEALGWLADLVALHDAGLCEPLPMPLQASFDYACARRRGAQPAEAAKAAATAWQGSRSWNSESREPEHQVVYGSGADFSVLTGALPDPADGVCDWPEEPTRFGVLSRRWWDPMLEGELRPR